jgi:Histidine kinase-like ATPase domain
LTVALVELSFPARPVHVRTARLVAVALARRAELAAEVLEEIRLAVSEACGVALSILDSARSTEPVAVQFDDTDGFTVGLWASAPLEPATGEAAIEVVVDATRADADGDGLPAGAALAVVAELAPALKITTSARGMRLAMSWPPASDSGTG